jgi:hypothetical protein
LKLAVVTPKFGLAGAPDDVDASPESPDASNDRGLISALIGHR